jgi:ACS family tartrate transporter-like MFS transporter
MVRSHLNLLGPVSALTAFVRTPTQFYVVRFLLGVAEAGFFPGVIVYFTHWFTLTDRSRAMSGLLMAVPFSLALGAPFSALLLQVHWLGYAGWQWLFLVEGLPAVALGIITLLFLPDHPRDARWFKPEEREWLEGTLAAEAQAKKKTGGDLTVWQALRLPKVWILALAIFVTNTGGYAFAFWLPTAVKGVTGASVSAVLGWSALIYACGMLSVFVSGQSSDRTGDRKWHCVAGQVGAAVFLAGSTIPGQSSAAVIVWLCLTGFAATSGSPVLTLPTLTLAESAAAVSIGFINVCANIAGGWAITGSGSYARAGSATRRACSFSRPVTFWVRSASSSSKSRRRPANPATVPPRHECESERKSRPGHRRRQGDWTSHRRHLCCEWRPRRLCGCGFANRS